MNTPIRDEIRSRIPEPRAIEDMIAFAGSVESVLRRIINDFPRKRDWLDPQLEQEAKFILQANAICEARRDGTSPRHTVMQQPNQGMTQMTDRKLIEKAAKAFDIEGEHRTEHLCVDGDWMDVTAIFLDDGMGWWNPLEDDGDALRLAVKLRMNLAFDEWDVGNDDYADTRRAIVIAAAAIADA